MPSRPLRVLHAIHDFLPRHQAGSEIYAAALCRALACRHHVTVLCAEYDPARAHGAVHWRMHDGLPVVEIVNNWRFGRFEETYRPPSLEAPLEHVLRATAPDVVHVHSLLNLSFDLIPLARRRGASVVATLHDYTMVCPSGGQRVHRAEQHVCEDIEAARCARCFHASPWASQMAASRVGAAGGARALTSAARWLNRRFPALGSRAARTASRTVLTTVEAADIEARLAAARSTLQAFDLVAAPSASIAGELARFGLPPERTVVSGYGFAALTARRVPRNAGPLRIGFVGTPVWHKGAHLLLEAARRLTGQWTIAIAGDLRVSPVYAAELRRLAEGLPVTFTGRFERDAAAATFADLDVLVVPSLWPENAPLVIHEAFMAGVPVVGFRVGGIPELVTDGVNGLLVDAGRADALASAIQRLVDAPSLVATLAAGCPPVRSIDDDAAAWEARYASLAHAARRPA